jgi:hypothetical protein
MGGCATTCVLGNIRLLFYLQSATTLSTERDDVRRRMTTRHDRALTLTTPSIDQFKQAPTVRL